MTMKYIKTTVKTHFFPDFIQHIDHYNKHMNDEVIVSAGFAYIDDDMKLVGYGKSISLQCDSEPLNMPLKLSVFYVDTYPFDYFYLTDSLGGAFINIEKLDTGDLVVSTVSIEAGKRIKAMIKNG